MKIHLFSFIFLCLLFPFLFTGCAPETIPQETQNPPEAPVSGFVSDPDRIAAASESVFIVETFDDGGSRITSGSGFLMFEGDILVTSAHVAVNAASLRITGEDGTVTDVLQTLLIDEASDTAIFRLECSAGTPLIPETETVKGEPVLAVGSSNGIVNLVTSGTLSGFSGTGEESWIVFSAAVSAGESGGALFNNNGRVIGVIMGSVKDAENINLASPIANAVRLFSKGE